MKALLCELLFVCVLAAPGARSIDELTYGTMLYAYLQEDYAGALVEVMVADERGRLGEDPARFTLARGSLAFAEGLHGMSDAAFAGLDPGSLDEVNRMRLAFHRARAHHRDAEWGAMAADLDAIAFEQTWLGRDRHHPEIAFMRAEAALASGAFAAAEQALAPLPSDEDYLGYGLFNLAVAYREAGNLGHARDALARLADLPLASDAGQDLVQRGRLGLAIATGEAAAAVDAQQVLDRLPGTGRYRDQALAVYGDVAMSRQDYRLAARIWLTLQESAEWHAGRAQAELGLPMALEGLAAPAQALEAYHRAAAGYESRLTVLGTLAESATDAAWPAVLLEAYVDARPDAPELTPPGVADTYGRSAWLAWLAQEDVNRLLVEWRELQRMNRWLEQLPEQLGALEQVKDERLRRSQAARALLAQRSLGEQRDMLVAQTGIAAQQLDAIADPGRRLDSELVDRIGSSSELQLLERLDALASQAAGDAALAARIARLRGVVLWQISEARSQRVRALVSDLERTRTLVTGIDDRIARITHAEAELAAGVEADFAGLGGRAEALTAAVGAGLELRKAALAVLFRDALERETERTEQYLLAARVAIARTSDQLAASTTTGGPES